LSTGSEVSIDDGESNAANLSAGSNAAHGPPGLADPYREQIEAGLRQGLTAQRIWQDLCAEVAYPHSYASVRRYVRRLKHAQPKLVDVMEHPPGEEAQVDFFQGPPTFDAAQGRWRRPWIFRMTLSCSKHGYEEPLWTQERDGFLRAHEHAFVRLGGVPKIIRPDYVPRHIIELLCPSRLCGRRAVSKRESQVNARYRPHNNRRQAGQFKRDSSALQIGSVRNTPVVL
jgi:transposase